MIKSVAEEAIASVLDDIFEERVAQNDAWGVQNHDDEKWFRILMEEVGEVALAMNEHEPAERIEEELIQVAAVAASWVESRRRQGLAEAARRQT